MRTAVCGIGNPLRGDDGVGPLLLRCLKGKLDDKETLLLDCGSTPESFSKDIIAFRPDRLLIVDAADFGARPGEWKTLDVDEIPKFGLSTHSMPLSVFIKYILGRHKCEIVFLGIQPDKAHLGLSDKEGLSPACRKALDEVRGYIIGFLGLRSLKN